MECKIFIDLLDDISPYIDTLPEDLITDILVDYKEYQKNTNDTHSVFQVILNETLDTLQHRKLLTVRDVAIMYDMKASTQRAYRERKHYPLPTVPPREERKAGTKILYDRDEIDDWFRTKKHLG